MFFKEYSDDELMEKIKKGESKSFELLFNRHSSKILGYAYRLLGGDKMKAEDLSQSTWVRIVERADTYQNKGNFLSWALTITRHMAHDEWKKRKEIYSDELVNGHLANLKDSDESGFSLYKENIEQILLKEENQKLVKKAIDELPEMQRKVLITWMSEELSYEEISAHFSLSISSIKSLLFRARRSLEERLTTRNI